MRSTGNLHHFLELQHFSSCGLSVALFSPLPLSCWMTAKVKGQEKMLSLTTVAGTNMGALPPYLIHSHLFFLMHHNV